MTATGDPSALFQDEPVEDVQSFRNLNWIIRVQIVHPIFKQQGEVISTKEVEGLGLL